MRTFLVAFSLILAAATVTSAARGADLQSVAENARTQPGVEASRTLRELDDALAKTGPNPRPREDLEMALIKLLQENADLELKLYSCQRLAIVGTEKCLPALASLLRSDDTVGMACLALANCPRAKADSVLREALPYLDGVPLMQVISTLGHRRDAKSVPALIQLTSRAEVPIAERAVIALGRIADRAARRALADLRKTPRPALGAALDEATLLEAESLMGERNPKAARVIYEQLLLPSHAGHVRAGALSALLTQDLGRAQDRILRILDREDPSLQPDEPLRPVAIQAIGGLGSARAGLTFAGLIDRLPTHEQVLLIQALADLGEHCPRSALASHVESDVLEVRLAVIAAFGQLNDPSDIGVFAQALAASRTSIERQAIETALARLPGGAETDRAILAQLSDPPAKSQAGLLAALARRGSRTAVPKLFAAARSSIPDVARAGFQGLGRLGSAAELPALIDLYAGMAPGSAQDDAEAALARILARMPDTSGRAQAVCAKLEAATAPEVRVALIRLLPMAGGPTALEAVRKAAQSPDDSIRDAGIRALSDWPALDAADDLIRVYQESAMPAHAALALRGLTRLARDANLAPSQDLIKRYRAVLEAARNDEDRRAILGALAGCSHPDALALALEQRQRETIRPEADQAIRQIADSIKGAYPQIVEAALKALAD